MNSLAGFISTMANVYGAQHGELSTTSKVTIIVTAASTGVLGILTAIYIFWLVRSSHNMTKRSESRELESTEKEKLICRKERCNV